MRNEAMKTTTAAMRVKAEILKASTLAKAVLSVTTVQSEPSLPRRRDLRNSSPVQ
jgi:hypothetical protein